MNTTSTTTCRAAVVRSPDGPEAIEIVERPLADPGPGEVLVKIAAAAVNPVDLAVAGGLFHGLGLVHQPEWTGLGWDFAGIVTAAGGGVDLSPGTRVAGFVEGVDRDFGSYAEYVVAPARSVAGVPEDLDLVAASTVPLNGQTASQMLDLLGDPPTGANRLLVTGAAGAVGAAVSALAGERGWQVTGLARAEDEDFVRGLGVDFTTTTAARGWDAVADGAALQENAVDLVRDRGAFVGVLPSAPPAAVRGITVATVVASADSGTIASLLERAASGALPARVHAVVPLDQVADTHQAVAKGGIRGRFVLEP